MKHLETLSEHVSVPRIVPRTREAFRVFLIRNGIMYPVCEARETECEALWDRCTMTNGHPDGNYTVRRVLAWLH